MRKLILILLALPLLNLAGRSQTVTPAILNASGGTTQITYYRFEWSFGELLDIETQSTPNITVTNGILQPYTQNPATTDNSSAWDADEIKVLPNPVINVLEIDFFSKQKGKVILSFIDASGKLITNRQFDYYGTGRIEKLDVNSYAAGAYFLTIILQPAPGSVAKKGSFKIIKLR